MTVRFYSSTAQPTTLALNVTAASTTIQVVALVGYPSLYPYTLCLDYDTGLRELVEVTNAAGTTLTVTRGVDGTSAIDHSAGATVRHVSSARDYADSRSHENATSDVHGVDGELVGTEEIQTLSNKTIENLVVNSTATNTQAITVNSNVAQAEDAVRFLDKNGTKRFWMDANGNTHVSSETGQTGFILSTEAGTPDNQGLFEGYDSAGNLIYNASNKGAFETRPNLAVRGIAVNSPNTYTGIPFEYLKNSVSLFSVSNSGSVSTAGSVSATTGISTAGNLSVSGDINTSANMDMGAWPDYNPVWSTPGTAPNIGNGSLTGEYREDGKSLTVHIRFVPGSTTTFGTGAWRFSMPVGFTMATTSHAVGMAWAFDSGTANITGTILADAPNNRFVLVGPNTGSEWQNTIPFTWVNGDTFTASITVQIV